MLFRSLIGAPFEQLPGCVRAVHEGEGARVYSGSGSVTRGASFVSRACGFIARLPPGASTIPIRVEIKAHVDGETWERNFGGHRFRSHMGGRDGLLEERMGLATFRFALLAEREAIRWELRGVRVLGIPVPARWFADVTALEWADGGIYHFEVKAQLPLAGLLVHYRGALAPA